MEEYQVKVWVCEVLQEWLEEATEASNGNLSVPEALAVGLWKVRNKVRTANGG